MEDGVACIAAVFLRDRHDELGFKETLRRLKYKLVKHLQPEREIENVQYNEDPHDLLCFPLGSALRDMQVNPFAMPIKHIP